MKLEFAKDNLVPAVQEVVGKFTDQELARASQSDDDFDIERVASDIIILLLTGGQSSNDLFTFLCVYLSVDFCEEIFQRWNWVCVVDAKF